MENLFEELVYVNFNFGKVLFSRPSESTLINDYICIK